MTAINTPYATLRFANIFTPRPRAEGGNPVYSCSLIFDPAQQKSPAYKALAGRLHRWRRARSSATTSSSRASTCRSATRARSPTTAIMPVTSSSRRGPRTSPASSTPTGRTSCCRRKSGPVSWSAPTSCRLRGRIPDEGRLLRPQPSPDHPERRAPAPRRTAFGRLRLRRRRGQGKRGRALLMASNLNGRPHPGDLLSLRVRTDQRAGNATTTTPHSLEQNFREAAAVASVVIGKEPDGA